MARLRRGEGHENTSQPLPLVPEASVEDRSARENSEPPPLPGYPTLEIDLNALGDVAPWRSSNNAASDEPGGKA